MTSSFASSSCPSCMAIRHCIFLMGVTGGGRTEAYRVLAKAMQKGVNQPEKDIINDYLRPNNKKKVVIRDINPKSISTQEFYGYVNLSTREWKDGMMSYYMRELATIPDEDPKWIILDGDLDANWIESMNSTMDDNRLLTLPFQRANPSLATHEAHLRDSQPQVCNARDSDARGYPLRLREAAVEEHDHIVGRNAWSLITP